jgi:alkaline phosphatase
VGTAEEDWLLYGYYEPLTVTLTHILNERAGIAWTSYSHTGVPVPVLALGKNAYLFDGFYDNTDIAKKIADAVGVSLFE